MVQSYFQKRAYKSSFCCLLTLIIPYACSAQTKISQPMVVTIPVGDTPNGIAITLDGAFAYVANNNNNAVPNGDTVSVINLKTNTIQKTISDASFSQPYTVTISPDGSKAYVTNSNSTTITIIDTATISVIGVINGFDGPSGMAITPDGMIGYVTNYGGPEGLQSGNGHSINIVNLAANQIVGTIAVDLAPAGLAITPNGSYLYVINYVDGNPGTGTVNVINTRTNSIVATIPGFSGPFALAITPNGQFVYVTNFGSNNFTPVGTTVSVIQTSTNSIVKTIEVGIQPAGIGITPDGSSVYVTIYDTLYEGPNYTDLTPATGIVKIISTATNSVNPHTITVGCSPAQVAITPNGRFVYTTNYSSNDVSSFKAERMWLS